MILAIDQGTTGTTCIVFGDDFEVAGRAYGEITPSFPQPGWVEHDPEEIWSTSVAVAREAIAATGIDASGIDAIGISNQRETVVAWDAETGRPVAPAIVWQDRRTAARCAELVAAGMESLIRSRTGLVCDPYFSATKAEWLLANTSGLDAGRIRLGTIDTWLVNRLTGEYATDHSNASRTMLFDIEAMTWDSELCGVFGIDADGLPAVLHSAEPAGYGATTEFGPEILVAGVVGDQQAALFGQGCRERGQAKCTYGTGAFLLTHAGTRMPPPSHGLVTTLAATLPRVRPGFALEASMFTAGAAVQWLRDGLGLIEGAAETEVLARSLQANDGVHFVPALAGLGSPWWEPDARGAITGLTRGSSRAHLARAALEAIAFQVADAVTAQERALGAEPSELRVDGGATANSWLMQFQADVLGIPVIAAEMIETTALGAARLAAHGIGAELGSHDPAATGSRWEPRIGDDERAELIAGWHAALASVLGRDPAAPVPADAAAG